jgi:hypothetical protein
MNASFRCPQVLQYEKAARASQLITKSAAPKERVPDVNFTSLRKTVEKFSILYMARTGMRIC